MGVMSREQKAGLARLMLIWPEGRAAVRSMAMSDAILLELCECYELACGAADFWSKSNSFGSAVIANEYTAILTELEHEIRHRVIRPPACKVSEFAR
jgi:hypothetical protein